MKRLVVLAVLIPLAGALAADGAAVSRLEADGELPAAALAVPPGGASGRPLLVVLGAAGVTPEDVVARFRAPAATARYALLAPAARGLAFAEGDLEGVAARAYAVRDRLGAGPVFLLGETDAAVTAVHFAFARPRLFRAVVAVGADAPETRERAPNLRLLVMKAAGDRPLAARESAERLAGRVEAADFRELPASGELDAPSLAYLRWFLDLAAGDVEAGRYPAIDWRNPARGAAEAKAAGRTAFVYLFDGAEEFRERTLEIQGALLFEPSLRRALESSVPVLAPRERAEKIFPDLRLAPGPALVVTAPDGTVVVAEQRKLAAKTLVAALEGR